MRRRARSNLVIGGVVFAAAAIFGAFTLAGIGEETGLEGFLAGLIMAAVPVPFYIAFTLWIDRFEPEPSWLLLFAFVWGAAIAVFFSYIVNGISSSVFVALAGDTVGDMLAAGLSAPIVEEIAKGTALFVLFLWKYDEFDNVMDGIVYATMVGLGFAMTENVAYYGKEFVRTGGSAAALFVARGIMAPFAHPLFTSMTGIALGAVRETDDKTIKWLAPPAGLLCAMLLHAIWNLSAALGVAFFAAYAFVMVPAGVIVAIIAILALGREATIIRTHLESVVAEGVLSRDDVIVVTSVWKRLRATGRALMTGGLRAWSARRRFHDLTADLAFHSWRTSRQRAEYAEELRVELLAQLRAARARLGLTTEEQPDPALVARLSREIPVPILPSVIAHAASGLGATLRCTSGPLVGQSFSIGYTGLTIGRDPASAQIVIRHPGVSRKHAWVGAGESGLMLVDRASTNGTCINGVQVNEAPLRPGDVIELPGGAATFELTM